MFLKCNRRKTYSNGKKKNIINNEHVNFDKLPALVKNRNRNEYKEDILVVKLIFLIWKIKKI